MRSGPPASPKSLPSLLRDRTAYFTGRNQNPRASDEIVLSEVDSETSQLLPQKRNLHHVRVQGRLAVVRSVSIGDLKTMSREPSKCSSTPLSPRNGPVRPSSSEKHKENRIGGEKVSEKDMQFRGYGIGGAGNIRRPMDVAGASTGRTYAKLWSLTSLSNSKLKAPLILRSSAADLEPRCVGGNLEDPGRWRKYKPNAANGTRR
ncbi:hypothetical protein F5Y15DRAFT_417177 [Xylariaceae sp. FL0016]|nr:hypothetical protein F5Y15DRAFT_417177 [Xylariaceae sp. FL0016]